jgi:DNA-3-methyladenine glycosylase II
MTDSTVRFTMQAAGPFDLALQNQHFGGWLSLAGDAAALVLCFPLELADAAAAVVLRQTEDGAIAGEVHGIDASLADAARAQALAALSLDVDGTGWPAVGERDSQIGGLQERYGYLRPVLFHSPYEAAASFILGHRISIVQVRALRARLAEALGTAVMVDDTAFHAFPTPAQVLEADELPGVPLVKAERLRAVARAVQDGWLTRASLRELPVDEALARVRSLPGVGPFFAQGIVYRGAGVADAVSDDEVTLHAVTERYGLARPADRAKVAELGAAWAPYRTWATVLLHVWARSEGRMPRRR